MSSKSRSSSIAQLFSRSNSIVQLQKTRADREEHNHRQAFFKLPAELRLEIYAYCIPDEIRLNEICLEGDVPERTCWASKGDKRQWVYNPQLHSLSTLPPLLGVCQQIRSEFIPLFYQNTTAVLLLHSLQRQKLFADALCDWSLSCVRQIELCTSFKHVCWNDQRALLRYAVIEPVKVFIDRDKEIIDVRSRGEKKGAFRPGCCRNALKKDMDRLEKEIEATEIHKSDHRLRGKDFKDLAKRTDTALGKKILKY